MDGFVLTWAGECSAWECDDLGHLNMRFYVKKFGEARKGMIMRLGLTEAFKPGTPSSVRVRDLHIKYQGEARPGDPLKIVSGVIKLMDQSVQLCHIMYHEDGRIAATALEIVEHLYLAGGRIFDWPKRLRLAAKDFMVDLPLPAKPRNIDVSQPHIGRGLKELNHAGVCTVGAGVFHHNETDITGFVTPGSIFGRTTSTVAWFKDGWPELFDPEYRAANLSAALLEARLIIHKYPEEGDAYHYVPVLIDANQYTRRFVHNLGDPVTGESWATMEACGCKFDLNERRLIKMSEGEIEDLLTRAKPELTP